MRRILITLGLALIAADRGLAGQDPVIYRCENAGVIEFSDQPCQDDADSNADQGQHIHESSGSVSVISPPDDLDEIQQANRSWLQDYRARQTVQETMSAESRPERVVPSRLQHEAIEPRKALRPVIWPYHPPPYFHRSPRPPRYGEPQTRQQPYSALSGPFPGTRPRNPEQDVPPNR